DADGEGARVAGLDGGGRRGADATVAATAADRLGLDGVAVGAQGQDLAGVVHVHGARVGARAAETADRDAKAVGVGAARADQRAARAEIEAAQVAAVADAFHHDRV